MNRFGTTILVLAMSCVVAQAEDPPTSNSGAAGFPKPYSAPCVERENVFEFKEKPAVKVVGQDRYEITFAVKGYCDVTVGILDSAGVVVRHLGAGVLGANAPAPFQKNSLKQIVCWDGKDDLDEYCRAPEKLKVRVMLGLKPEFDKWLGGASPHNLPGRIMGLAGDPDGVTIFSIGNALKVHIRRFGWDGKYLRTLTPPAASMPEEKLKGMGFVEYELGKKSIHAADIIQTCADYGRYMDVGKFMVDCQAVVVGDRIYYLTSGGYGIASLLHYLHTDGSTDLDGCRGRPFVPGGTHCESRLAVSPDGKWLYMSGDGTGSSSYASDNWGTRHHILRCSLENNDKPTVFFGGGAAGPGPQQLFSPGGMDCDAEGRLYICDRNNNRLQVVSPDGRLVKTIPIDRPLFVCVHKKTGALYVQHEARVEGQTVRRLTKLAGLADPKEEARLDNGVFGLMVLDSWSPKPRLWAAGGESHVSGNDASSKGRYVITVWEEDGKTFKKIMDFEDMAKQADGPLYAGRFSGSALSGKVVCDPLREKVYYENSRIFDLQTGRCLGGADFPSCVFDDIAFDKKGYVHIHFNPGYYLPGVGRAAPADSASDVVKRQGDLLLTNKVFGCREVPYDYGVEAQKEHTRWLGVLPVKDQGGSKFFQDGIGVNMRGDVAENCNIYYVPKMDDVGLNAFGGSRESFNSGARKIGSGDISYGSDYANWLRKLVELEKQGIATAFIKRSPGLPLCGATVWTWNFNGELRQECAAVIGNLIGGVQIDEDGKLYLVNNRSKMIGGKPFLDGQGGTFGAADDKHNLNVGGGSGPFTGTLMKMRGAGARVLLKNSPVPMDAAPARPPELRPGYGEGGPVWVEGAEWLYAGASPIVHYHPCSCPTQRGHLDWYKRSYVPEAYRHSIGVLDTSGNLIMHVGRYGNHDDALAMRPGSTDISQTFVRFVSGTDNYMCFEDNGERLVVLRLNYHAEESVGIGNK